MLPLGYRYTTKQLTKNPSEKSNAHEASIQITLLTNKDFLETIFKLETCSEKVEILAREPSHNATTLTNLYFFVLPIKPSQAAVPRSYWGQTHYK